MIMADKNLQADTPKVVLFGDVAVSAQRPSVCRVLHAYGARWKGPRPAICVNDTDPKEDPHGNSARVNIQFDGSCDQEMLARVRERAIGNTFTGVPVFDALTAEQRSKALEASPGGVIVEWPPRV
jgi:hypothetical protein